MRPAHAGIQVIAVAVAALALAGCEPSANPAPPSPTPTASPTADPSSSETAPPVVPPTTTSASITLVPQPGVPSGGSPGQVCDKQPATYPTAPAGAVIVEPGVAGDADRKTRSSNPGTTFWFKPGTHTLGADQYSQIQPKDGNSYLGAPGAIIDGKGVNAFAFTQHATNVTISNLVIQNFEAPLDQGVVNHDSGDNWTIRNSTIQNNAGAGMMAGAGQQVLHTCLRDNGQYGMNAYKAGDSIRGIVIADSEIVGNNTEDWESKKPGCGCSGGVKFWAVNGADIRSTWVHDNRGAGLWADTNNNDFLIENNLIENNDSEAVFYETSYNMIMRDNVIRKNALRSGKAFADRGDGFPEAAIYLSESGGDPAVPARTSKIDIYGNTFDNNWSGITAWENADRFCNSPANSSSSYCTKKQPTIAKCSQPGIASAPLYHDCRWKTQRVDVHDNTFRFDPAAVGCSGGNLRFCGRNALLSNYGTYPNWTPYTKNAVQEAITFKQENRWSNNTYSGPWKFTPFEFSRFLTPGEWQGAPYNQDAGSRFS